MSGEAQDSGGNNSPLGSSFEEEAESEETPTFSNDEERRRNAFNFCLINARSLLLKLPSLLECLDELEVDV